MAPPHTPTSFEVELKIQWRRAGEIRLRRNGSLEFPPVQKAEEPGIYRIVWKKNGDQKKTVYIGESKDPRGRARSYRQGPRKVRSEGDGHVAPTVPPNRSVNLAIGEAVRDGFAEYQIAHVISIRLGNREVEPMMDRVVQRKLIESAALLEAQTRGRVEIFNADAWK